ncbi:MAG: tetratricopeptide repeat protein [Alphaproteobacteria bacterium]
MRILPNSLFTVSGRAILLLGACAIVAVSPAMAQQDDILLPADEGAPPLMDGVPDEPVSTDPAALTAPVETSPEAAAAAEDAMQNLLEDINQGGAPPADPAVPQAAPEVVDGAAPPADSGLIPEPDASATASTDVNVIPALPADKSADENLFFDADTLVPTGEMGANAPRKVNPALQPASKLIVVTKDHGPGSRQAQLVSAERAITLGRYDSALEIYNALYAKNSRDPSIVLGRAVALQHLGMYDEAINAYEELLDLRPENVQAQINMLGLMGQQYPAVALQRLSELREKEPQNVAVVGQMAVLQANMGQFDEALKYLGMAASLEPNNASHMYNMAVVADLSGKKDSAVQFYEQALEVDSIYGGSRSIPRDAVFERLARLR